MGEGAGAGVEKRGKGGVEFLPGDSELARPKTVAEATQGFSAVHGARSSLAAATGRSSLARLICGSLLSASQGWNWTPAVQAN